MPLKLSIPLQIIFVFLFKSKPSIYKSLRVKFNIPLVFYSSINCWWQQDTMGQKLRATKAPMPKCYLHNCLLGETILWPEGSCSWTLGVSKSLWSLRTLSGSQISLMSPACRFRLLQAVISKLSNIRSLLYKLQLGQKMSLFPTHDQRVHWLWLNSGKMCACDMWVLIVNFVQTMTELSENTGYKCLWCKNLRQKWETLSINKIL